MGGAHAAKMRGDTKAFGTWGDRLHPRREEVQRDEAVMPWAKAKYNGCCVMAEMCVSRWSEIHAGGRRRGGDGSSRMTGGNRRNGARARKLA